MPVRGVELSGFSGELGLDDCVNGQTGAGEGVEDGRDGFVGVSEGDRRAPSRPVGVGLGRVVLLAQRGAVGFGSLDRIANRARALDQDLPLRCEQLSGVGQRLHLVAGVPQCLEKQDLVVEPSADCLHGCLIGEIALDQVDVFLILVGEGVGDVDPDDFGCAVLGESDRFRAAAAADIEDALSRDVT